MRPVSRAIVAVKFADQMTIGTHRQSAQTGSIILHRHSANSGPNHAAANYRSFKVISGFITHFCSVTHLDPQVKLLEQTQQKIMRMCREVLK